MTNNILRPILVFLVYLVAGPVVLLASIVLAIYSFIQSFRRK